KACVDCIRTDPEQNADRVFTVLEDAITSSSKQTRLLVIRVCNEVRAYWDSEKIEFSASLIHRFLRLCDKTGQYLQAPMLKPSWSKACRDMRAEANQAYDDGMPLMS